MRQGDVILPTLFSIFINELATDIKGLDKGVTCGDYKLSILLYADDIILLAESETDLQEILNYRDIHKWYKKWRLRIKKSKLNVLHFRNSRNRNFVFTYGSEVLEISWKL